MKLRGPVAIALLIMLVFGGTLVAAPTVIGPFQDLRAPLGPFISGPFGTSTGCTGPVFIVADEIVFDSALPGSVNTLGVMYFSADNSDFTGPITITTIYGMDAAPGSPALHMTGFNPVSPELFPVSGETIFGKSGATYLSSSDYGAMPLSSLSSVFPELDLSLIQGSPSSVVFPFRTIVPSTDLTRVPEPTALAMLLCGMGALALALARRRGCR